MKQKISFEQLRKGVIVFPNWVGDAVMAHALLKPIVQRYPNLKWDAMAIPSVEAIVRFMPEINHIHLFSLDHGRLQWKERSQLARQIRLMEYDIALILPNNLKSALIPWLAGIPIRVGHLGEFRYGLLTHLLKRPSIGGRTPKTMVRFYQSLISLFDIDPIQAEFIWPDLRVGGFLKQRVREKFSINGDFLVIAPGAEYGPSKQWKAHHIVRLIQLWIAERGGKVVLLGSPKDIEITAQIMELLNQSSFSLEQVINLCGQTRLEEALALISQATAVVANDSGLMHAACALKIPVVAIYGPTSPLWAPPLGEHVKAVSLELACSPCRQRICPLGHHACMEDINAELIFASLKDVLVQTQHITH
jgi:heptosyltransferase-2